MIWNGRVAWITGGSSGIGAALARELARRGASVAVTARRQALLERVAQTATGRVQAFPADVRDASALAQAAPLSGRRWERSTWPC
jgi:dehydrogenase/reductase SDR family protein 7B